MRVWGEVDYCVVFLAHHAVDIIVFIYSYGLMVVKSLGFQDFSQLSLVACGFLYLRSFVLEPNLNLIVLKTEFRGQISSSLLGEVTVGIELVLEPVELLTGECCSRSLVCRGLGTVLLLNLSCSRS